MDILYKILFMCIINVVFIAVAFIIDEAPYGSIPKLGKVALYPLFIIVSMLIFCIDKMPSATEQFSF